MSSAASIHLIFRHEVAFHHIISLLLNMIQELTYADDHNSKVPIHFLNVDKF